MILTSLFSELARWLTENGRRLVVMPTPYGKSQQGEQELFEATWQISYGPCAVVTYRRAIVRMLRVPPDPRGPRPLLSDHKGTSVTHLIDLGGCYIQGQGVPLAVMLASNDPLPPAVRVVTNLRGEPRKPAREEWGRVYKDLLASWDRPGETPWSQTQDVPRGDVDRLVALLGGSEVSRW